MHPVHPVLSRSMQIPNAGKDKARGNNLIEEMISLSGFASFQKHLLGGWGRSLSDTVIHFSCGAAADKDFGMLPGSCI